MQGALPAPVMLQPQGNFTGAGNVSGPETFPAPGRQSATAVTADGKHTARATSPMPSAGLTPPTPSGASTPSSSSHPRQQCPHPHPKYGGRGEGGGGVSITPHHAGTPQPHHPGHHHTHQHAPGRHHDTGTPRPLQAPKTCATRTPPPGATGAHLSALQAHTQASNTHTADRPSAARTRTHSRTAATTMSITTSHHDTPKSAVTTKATKHQHKRTRAQPSQPVQHATL